MTQEMYPGFTRQDPAGNKKRNTRRIILFIVLIPAFLVVLVPLYFFISSVFFPNDIEGDLLDLTYIPGKNGIPGKLWIQTDGSFSYISKSSSPGKTSVGRKGLFCKTFSIIYDPVQKKVLQKIKTPFIELPPPQNVFYKDGKVWVVSRDFSGTEPLVDIYDPDSGAKVSDTKDFISKYPELNSGMSTLSIQEDPKRFNIATHDGRNVIYSVDKDKVYANDAEFKKAFEKPDDERVAIFTLGNDDGNNSRKKLYKVTGPYSQIVARNVYDFALKDASSLKLHNNAEAELLTPQKVYIEGILLYKDDEIAIILHQSQIGKSADRMLTCVDMTGKERWTAGQDQLFRHMGVREEDAFSIIFFMKDKFKIERSDNVIIFKFTPEGVLGLDAVSGKKLWEIEI